MKDLINRYLDRGISRRNFLASLGALGVTKATANSILRSLTPFLPQEANAAGASVAGRPSWMQEVHGTGGALLVAQLKAANIRHIFFGPSTGAAPFYDALVDESEIHLIKVLHEGAMGAMAAGYAKASGRIAYVMCARPGFPNFMTQMFNAYKDQVPVVIGTDYLGREATGRNGFEDVDHMDTFANPITKWHWVSETPEKIPEITRRGIKLASTAPYGPVFLAFPEDTLSAETKAIVMDESKFDVDTKVRPDPSMVEKAARLLIEAKNPVLCVGDDITLSGAQQEVLELAELLGTPVTQSGGWSRPFPTHHSLYLGAYRRDMRFPQGVDVVVNLGGRNTGSAPDAKMIEISMDPTNLGRTAPAEMSLLADLKLGTGDLLAAVRSQATDARLKQIRDARAPQVEKYASEMRQFRESIAKGTWDRSPMSVPRMGMELEKGLEKDTCFVSELDTGKKMESLIALGGTGRQFFDTTGDALGWGLPGALGVQIAQPNKPVVAVLGDGAFLFAGPQSLWSYARYQAPVTVIILNNRSYNNERNHIMFIGGRQFQEGKDMTAYLGNPDLDYTKIATGFGVEAEAVSEPADFQAALQRAKRANADGRPYLLDVQIEREGIGAASTWYPPYSVYDQRQGKA